MPPKREDVIEVLKILSEEDSLKATVTCAAKSALVTGVCTFVGGVLGGPIGLFVGGSVGTVGTTIYNKGQFRSVVSIIQDMNNEQKLKLANAVSNVVSSIEGTDVAAMIAFLTLNPSIKSALVSEMGNFLKNEMSLTMS